MWVTEEKQSWGTLLLKAISERQEYGWNHTQGNVMSERSVYWSQWKNYSRLQEELNGLCDESPASKRTRRKTLVQIFWVSKFLTAHGKLQLPDHRACSQSCFYVHHQYCFLGWSSNKAHLKLLSAFMEMLLPFWGDSPKNLNSLWGYKKMSRLTDIRWDRYKARSSLNFCCQETGCISTIVQNQARFLLSDKTFLW